VAVSILSQSFYINSTLNLTITANNGVFKGLSQKDSIYSALKRSETNIQFNDSCYLGNYDTNAYLGNQTLN
jgi:hypothetical protein